MKAMIIKQFKLGIPSLFFLFLAMPVLLIIPNYPSFVGFGYAVMPIIVLLSIGKENKDLEFSSMLPVSKKDIVKGRMTDTVLFQVGSLVIGAICAVFTNLFLAPNGNQVGLDLNPTFFGATMIAYGVFNLCLLPIFFKTGYKIMVPAVISVALFLLTYMAIEILIALVPALAATLDTLNPAMLGRQFIVFTVGAAFFAASLFISYFYSVKNFTKVSL